MDQGHGPYLRDHCGPDQSRVEAHPTKREHEEDRRDTPWELQNASRCFLFLGKCGEFGFIADKGFVQVPFS